MRIPCGLRVGPAFVPPCVSASVGIGKQHHCLAGKHQRAARDLWVMPAALQSVGSLNGSTIFLLAGFTSEQREILNPLLKKLSTKLQARPGVFRDNTQQ